MKAFNWFVLFIVGYFFIVAVLSLTNISFTLSAPLLGILALLIVISGIAVLFGK